MRPDDDDFATIVIAQAFELVYGDGVAAADFGTALTFPVFGSVAGGLIFNHDDAATVRNGGIIWDRNLGINNDTIRMMGPSSVATGGVAYSEWKSREVRMQTFGDSVTFQTRSSVDVSNIGGSVADVELRAENGAGAPLTRIDLSVNAAVGNITVQTGEIKLNPSTGLTLNTRTARMLVNTYYEALASGVAFGAALTELARTSVDLACNAGDIMFIHQTCNIDNSTFTGISDCYVACEPILNGTPQGALAIQGHSNPVSIFHGRMVQLTNRYTAPSTGSYRFRMLGQNLNTGVNNSGCENGGIAVEVYASL